MEFLSPHANVPSPRVFDWACESDPTYTVGVGYRSWMVVRQLAEIMLEIEAHPFDGLESLVATRESFGNEATPRTSALESQPELEGSIQGSLSHARRSKPSNDRRGQNWDS
ncbi:unnamed protein product, partial [Clonostachys solani]